MNDVVYAFLSYSRNDKHLVVETVARFEANHWCRVFYDRHITPGAEWERVLKNGINNSDCFIALVSKSSIRSQRCRKEWAEAIECYKARGRPFLLPVTIDESRLPIELGAFHAIKLEDAENQQTVAAIVERAREHHFWSDAFFEANLQLALAKRILEGGLWHTDVSDPNMNTCWRKDRRAPPVQRHLRRDELLREKLRKAIEVEEETRVPRGH